MRIFHFLGMFFRRNFRKPAFLVVLALLPVVTCVYTAAAGEESSLVTVALARQDEADPLAQVFWEQLPESSQMLTFLLCDSPQEAADKVRLGKAEQAWVFHADLEKTVKKFLDTRSQRYAFVTVYQREDTPLGLLARERLNEAVFDALARALYLRNLRDASAALAALCDDALLVWWEETAIPGALFSYHTGGVPKEEGLLLSPLRGLLTAAVVLGAVCGVFGTVNDRRAGLFSYLPQRLQWLPEFLGQVSAQSLLCGGMLVCLGLAGVWGSFLWECLCLGLLALSSAAFAMALGRLIPSASALSAALSLVTVLALIACPVFFDIPALRPVGALLPVGHYLYAAADFSRIWEFILYTLVCLALALAPGKRIM